MTAVSPYAPPRRNSLLRRSSSSMQSPSPGGRRTALFAFFLFVIRFWKDVADLGGVSDFFQRRPRALRALEWIQNFLGFGDNHSFPSRIIQGIQGGRRPDADGVEFAPIRRISASSSSDQHSEASSVSDAPSTTTSKRIRENQLWIRRVLNYWFGQYAPDHSQKNLWMIANSSVELRYRVDREITETFETLLLELSSSSEGSRRWSDWCLDQDGIYGHQGKIATVIVLDQFSRHMQRHYENTTKGESQIPSKETLNALALKTAKLFVETHKKEISCGMIPVPMYIFSLMPYRHDNSIKSVVYVQQCVEECAGMNQQMEAMLGRFRKATNRRMAVLQDKARRTGNSSNHNKEDASNGKNDSTMYKDEEILESFPFEADLTPALNHPVHKTIASFLASRGINPSREGKEATEVCSPIIVSLSGGVDSMVIAAVLAHLKRSCGFHLQIIAVHIDYANRPESVAEADFVRRYCETLDITFRCREIKEVTRGVTARDEYEKMSREMRYGSYREAIEVSKEGIDPNVSKDMVVGVMLGHHKGDLRENVLSNAHKGCGPLDLSGMTAVSKNDGVTIYRPLLPLEKSFVFDYAHKFGVPYFKGTFFVSREKRIMVFEKPKSADTFSC